jgi:hypothetical protein
VENKKDKIDQPPCSIFVFSDFAVPAAPFLWRDSVGAGHVWMAGIRHGITPS